MIGTNGKNYSDFQSTKITVVLFDTKSDITELKNLIKKETELIVISFDYESHKSLLKNKINHIISDNYLKENDLEVIQKNSYAFSGWFKESKIVSLLDYKGINLGQLFQAEFHYLLVPLLKKFVEMTKIFKIYPNARFACSPSLYEIMKTFTDSVDKLKNNTEISNKFLHDSLKLHIKIGDTYLSLSIPKSYYLKIKNISEILIHKFFGPKRITPDSKKHVLLVEADTVRYRKLFSLIPTTRLNFMVFDRRRPAIWNLESFLIIRRSNCTVATYHAINDNDIQNSIKTGILQIKTKIDSLWNQQDFFKSFFVINDFSFWEILKPHFMELCEKRILEAIQEIEITSRLLEKYKFESIMVWSENGFNEQIIIKLAQRLKIPVVLIQHGGIGWDTPKACEFNKFAGVFPLESNKFITWGNAFKQYAIDCGIQSEKIEALGSPIYDESFDRKSHGLHLKNDFILLATSSPVNHFVYDLTVKTRENYELAIQKICQTISKMDKKLVIKLHPSQVELDVTDIAKQIDPKIIIVKKGNILPLIESCEVLLTIDITTAILEAQMFDKPVITVTVKDYGFGEPGVYRSNSCIKTNIDNFENALNQILYDNNFRKKLIENANKFVESSLSNRGTAVEEILSFLQKL